MLDELGLRELGKRVRDEEPRALAVDEDMLVRTKHRVAVEEARRNFEPGSTVRGTGETEEEWADSMAPFLGRKYRDRFVAIRPGGKGNATDTHVVWEATKGLNEMPSPLYYGGYVYIVADGGRLSAFRAKTGERILDRQRIGANGQYVGSPIAANGYIYLTSERGTITVVRPGDELDVVANNELGESVRSTPALAGNALVVRTKNHLWSLAE